MPNPSEIQRQIEELEEHRNVLRNLSTSKKSREYHLGEIYRLCRELGEEVPTYNTTAFSDWLKNKA